MLTAHQLRALAWIARYPGTDARCSQVGVSTADALERLGLVTVTRELTHARVRVSALTARSGTRLRPQLDVGVTLTDAGHAVLS